jgi:hypothetical protein
MIACGSREDFYTSINYEKKQKSFFLLMFGLCKQDRKRHGKWGPAMNMGSKHDRALGKRTNMLENI